MKVWVSNMNSLKLVTTLDTARYFTTEEMAEGSIAETCSEEWPPFRKVGYFDPFTDDPRSASLNCVTRFTVSCKTILSKVRNKNC